MSEGFLYEPRSFWSTQSVTPSISGITRAQLPKRHFYNGERWPIQIKRVAVMGLNYSLMEARDPNQSAGIINRVGIAISVPQRYHLNTRRFALMAALAPRPTWTPAALASAAGVAPSSLWGQSMLKPDKPMYIPRMGSIEWSLSSINSPGGATTNAQTPAPTAWMLYQEEGGLFAGSARTFGPVEIQGYNPTLNIIENSEERWPYINTGLGGGYSVITNNWWPPQEHFNAQIFNRQESTRAGSTKITDLRCMIDQRNADLSAFNNGVTEQQTPLSMRVGTRIRTVNSGTKTWWWRPGAPMALVFDHITPANVYELPKMITLGPGEQLDVELEFPQVQNTENDMQVAIALNGYAAIEG